VRLQSRSILIVASGTSSVRRTLRVHVVAIVTILCLALAVIIRDGVEVRAQVRAGSVGAGALVTVGDVLKGIVVTVLAVVGAGVGLDCSSRAEGFAGIDGTWADGISCHLHVSHCRQERTGFQAWSPPKPPPSRPGMDRLDGSRQVLSATDRVEQRAIAKTLMILLETMVKEWYYCRCND
jgi:hypothetical protein